MRNPGLLPSLDGRRFAALVHTEGGEVGPETVFEYHEDQESGEIWASYSGGTVRRGFLVGTRSGDVLTFRYSQLNDDHETSSGRCVSQIVREESGLLRLDEVWSWETRPGSGTSAVREITGRSVPTAF